MATHEFHSDSHALNNGTEVVWQLPKTLPIIGILLLAHGCKQTPRVWFAESSRCSKCIPRPEEMCMAQKALSAGYAVIGISNLKGTKGCWERDDIEPVARKLQQWRTKRNMPRTAGGVPLYVLGVGSGGWFAANAGRVWNDVNAVALQASVPTLKEVQRKAKSGESKALPYPPLQMGLLERDKEKLLAAKQLLGQEWDGSKRAELVTGKKHSVTPEFFSDGIPGLRQNLSYAVHKALIGTGTINGNSNEVIKAPVRGELQKKVSASLGSRNSDVPQRSKSLAVDAIFARLDMAYAKEASSCELMDQTLAFFKRYPGGVSYNAVGSKGRSLNGTQVGTGSNATHVNGTHHGNGTHHHSKLPTELKKLLTKHHSTGTSSLSSSSKKTPSSSSSSKSTKTSVKKATSTSAKAASPGAPAPAPSSGWLSWLGR